MIFNYLNMSGQNNQRFGSMAHHYEQPTSNIEKQALKLIRENRCNGYLDLSQENIPYEVWNIIQNLYLNDKIYPRITTIDIRNTNLTLDQVNDVLRGTIII